MSGKKKGKMEKKRRKSVKGKVENVKWKGKRKDEKELGMSRGFLYIFFFFLLFTFWNHWNLFRVYKNENFYREIAFQARKKKWEKWLCPLKNIPLTFAKAVPADVELYSCSPLRVSRKLWTVCETVSCMQQLCKRFALRTCYCARASLWRQRQGLNYAQSQPTVSSTLMHRF